MTVAFIVFAVIVVIITTCSASGTGSDNQAVSQHPVVEQRFVLYYRSSALGE